MAHSLRSFRFPIFFFLITEPLPLDRFIALFAVVVQLPICVQLFVTPWTAAHKVSLSYKHLPVCPLFYYLCLKLSDLISLFIIITSDWPNWYHFKAVCTNVQGLETVISIIFVYFLPVVLEEPRDHSYSTEASPMNCFNVNYRAYFNKKCSISLISLVRYHELGVGKLLHQSREILGCWGKCLRNWMLISVTLPMDQQYGRTQTSTVQWTFTLFFNNRIINQNELSHIWPLFLLP